MRGGALPPALLAAAVGFALAFAPRRITPWALLAFITVAVGVSFSGLSFTLQEPVFIGCWTSIVVAAASVHLPKGLGPRLAIVLAANTGVWAGAVISVAGAPLDLAKSLPWALLCLPAGWLVATGRGIAVKVVTSWLVAVALLAASLTIVPTPGYAPDHMD